MAAKRPSADADAPHNLRLIPHPDLAQLNPRLKHRRQIFHKLPEIDPPVRGKIKQHLIVVKCIFRIDQLHLQLMLFDLLQADLKGFLFLLLIPPLNLLVIFVRHADHGLKRLDDLFLIHLARAQDHLAELNPARRLHNHMIPGFYLHTGRIKIINLPGLPESDSDNLYHTINSPSL